ncbi:MAG: protein kinase [Thermoanaerobaculia bacterium]|nr:protein kinase [Thermoanaerobaculia bacterium]
MIGRTVGHYRVLEALGEGGMGVVYKAEDLTLGRPVALKFLPPEMTREEEARKRFLREARAASKLDHQNICTVYEVGETDGQAWIAMACYDGETLRAKIERGPLPIEDALRLTTQIARGLAKAHAVGIVHRDIKPANVIVTSESVAKIVDFGLAKVAGTSQITQSNAAPGTLAYMAPEQLRTESVGPPADLWALGVVLFELVTGAKPFRGEYVQAVAYSILNEPPPALAELRNDVPAQLDAIVRKLLRKDPAQRYQSAEELLTDLGTLREQRSGATRPTAAPRREREILRAGAMLGPYQIVGLIGSGGSGDVYTARDTKLDRQVAVKVLSSELADDAERKRAIHRCAKTVASLGHANICTLIDVGDQDDAGYLVMEHLDGETLAVRLTRGPMAVAELLAIGIPVADALGRAQREGVIHGNLKPGNVFLTRDGGVKLLDFGLGRSAASVLEDSGAGRHRALQEVVGRVDDPTERRDAQQRHDQAGGTGASTLPYVAPEQVEEHAPDARSDVFALGAILYEMAAGRRAFQGATKASLVAAILKEEPPPLSGFESSDRASRGADEGAAAFGRVVRRCLEKKPDARWQSALDVANELRHVAREVETESGGRSDDANGRNRRRNLLVAGLALATIASIVLALVATRRAAEHESSGASPGPDSVPKLVHLTTERGNEWGPSISPDGSSFAYAATAPQSNLTADIFVRRIGGENAINLTKDYPGVDATPSFSPDGSSIAFYSARDGGGIFVMGATGESVRRVTDFGNSPVWSPDGRSLLIAAGRSTTYYDPRTAELWVVDAASGSSRKALEGWYFHGGGIMLPDRGLSWSPSGNRIAFAGSRHADPESARIFTIPAGGGEPIEVSTEGVSGVPSAWTREGIWFTRRGSGELWTVPVDEESGVASGPPRLRMQSTGLSGPPSVTPDGRRVVFANATGGSNLLGWDFDASSGGIASHPRTIASMTTALRFLAPSPDGKWFASSRVEPQWDILLIDATTGERRLLTNDVLREDSFKWSPDGSRLYYDIAPKGSRELWSVRVDGSQPRRELPSLGEALQGAVPSPDGRSLVVFKETGELAGTVSLADEPSKRTLVPMSIPLLPDGSTFGPDVWSPDGRTVVGYSQDGNGVFPLSLYLYDVERKGYRKLADLSRLWNVFWFPDSRRMLLADWNSGAAEIIDAETGRVRSLGSLGDGVGDLRLSSDGRSLFGMTSEQEWDVWMLEYGHAGGGPSTAKSDK